MTTAPAAPNSEQPAVSVTALRAVAEALFAGAGLGGAAAKAMAAALVEADQQGVASHGVAMVPMYIERLEKKSVTTAERASIAHDRDAVAVLDAGHMLGHLAADQAMALAMEKAARYGVGAVSVRHGFHFGVAGRTALASPCAIPSR